MRHAGIAMPSMSTNKFEKYCQGIVSTLLDEAKCVEAFKVAVKTLDAVLDGNYGRDKAKKSIPLLLAAEKVLA